MNDLIRNLINSKKFIAAIVGFIVAAGARVGLHLDPTTVATLVSPFIAYIIGQGMADKGKHAAEITALAEISPSEAKAVIKKKAETK
jgi:uncharacterized membrane protein (DUF441 family)